MSIFFANNYQKVNQKISPTTDYIDFNDINELTLPYNGHVA